MTSPFGLPTSWSLWSDRRVATTLSVAFFVSLAWPIFFLDVPPYQDLPGHLATVTVLRHPELYPDFASNGWFKANAALVAWTYFAGGAIGLKLAARVFVLATLAANALVLPRFVLHFGGRRRMLVAAPFAWPMDHNWFVSMGMLNFALGVALALALLMRLDGQRRAPTRGRAGAIALLGVATWYASGVPLLGVGVLVAVEILSRPSWRDRLEVSRRLVPPLGPVALLVVFSVVQHATETGGRHYGVVGDVHYDRPFEILYNAWAHWFYAFTELEAVSLLPAIVLAGFALLHVRRPVPFFSPWALGVLVLLCFFLPSMMPGFGYVNDRFFPFLWGGALVRVPETLPRPLYGAVVLAGAINAAGLDLDLFRLARDQDEYVAGLDAVPEGSRLLALTFSARVTSKNTWSLRHASGLYVVERHTSAQDVWADSPTMPLRFRTQPTFFQDQAQVERFVENMGDRAHYCEEGRKRGEVGRDCEADWRSQWDWLWREAALRFDRVLMFAPTADALTTVPATWRECVHEGRLVVLAPSPEAAR